MGLKERLMQTERQTWTQNKQPQDQNCLLGSYRLLCTGRDSNFPKITIAVTICQFIWEPSAKH